MRIDKKVIIILSENGIFLGENVKNFKIEIK